MFNEDDIVDGPEPDPNPSEPDPTATPQENSPESKPEEDEEDFGRMLEESLQARSFEQGETVRGVVVAIWPDVAFVDIGGKGEATIDIEELKDPEGDLEIDVGDRIEAVIVSTAGGVKLSHKLARGAANRQQIEDAYHAGLPVEGKVEKVIKGGYEVRVAGQRAFCPISQIDIIRTEDPAVHEGEIYTFRIKEYKEGGKDLVVSRRALLEEEQREVAEQIRSAIVSGAVLTGRVASVRDYGAFVELGGGIQGLLHVSEMGWSRVSNPAEIVTPGDEITVKVLHVDDAKGRIALGLKQLQADPWSEVGQVYAVGQVHTGRVTRLADFGAFVELAPGIEALAHVSTFPPTRSSDGWKSSVPAGSSGAFEILSLDLERKRIGVAMLDEGSVRAEHAHADAAAVDPGDAEGGSPTAAPRPPARPKIFPGARLVGKVERHEKYGVFVYLAPGKTGLMPLNETSVEREGDLRKTFPVGSDVEVLVLEIDPSGRRIRLSRRAVLEAKEQSEAREYAAKQDQEQAGGFSSLADKLRAALGPKDD